MGDYGVLLPMQLETRFIPPLTSATEPGKADETATGWRLRLRVIPDRASVAARRTTLSADEQAALQAMLDTLGKHDEFPDPVPAEPELRRAALTALPGWTDAFDRLARAVGAARASTLIDTVPITGDPARVPDGTVTDGWLVPEVLGLPPRIDVWVQWAGTAAMPTPQPQVIEELIPNTALLTLDPLPSPDSGIDARWWASWEAAKAAGLAVEIPLDRDPAEIDVLGITGLGTADGGAAALFTAHAEAGDLAVLRPGVATSTAFGSTTVDLDAFEHWATHQGVAPHPAVSLLAGPGVGAGNPVDPLLGIHEEWSRRILAACYPALWGYGLQGVLGVVRDPRDPEHRPEHAEASLALWGWASQWLRPEGPFPPIRIGDQSYGVLALAAPSSELVAGLHAAASAAVEPVTATPLAQALGRIARGWAEAAEQGLSDGDPARRIRQLWHGPVPARLRRQDLIPVVTDAVRLQRDAFEELEGVWDDRAAVAWTLGQEELGWRSHGRLYRAFGPSRRLGIPVLGAGIDGGTQQVRSQEFDDLVNRAIGAVFDLPRRGIPGLVRRDRAPESLLLALYHRSVAVSTQLLWNADPTGAIDETHPLARTGLLEPLGAPAGDTRAAAQAERLVRSGEIDDLTVPGFVADALDKQLLEEVLRACAEEPALRPVANRAVRALADASAGRWDPWLSGIGAAHASEVVQAGGRPALGVYGWVDKPCRGTPGPGPGGFHLAPSRDIAGTLAVLRDRAVVDGDRWGMQHDSEVVGAARRWLADLALGWHPAELLGRMLEHAIAAAPGLTPPEAASVIADLREARPLLPEPGGFGCTHGLNAVGDVPAGAHPAVLAAIEQAERMLRVAADLELAEGVHGILTDRPARAAAAMRGLAGAAPMPVPSWMEPEQPMRQVGTVVLMATAPAPAAEPAGPAGLAAPGFDAHLRAAFDGEAAWVVERGQRRIRITAADLRCSLIDVATLDDDTVRTMATLAAASGAGVESPAPEASTDDPIGKVRDWVRALHGRAAAVADVAPGVGEDAAEQQAQHAAGALTARLDDALRAAEQLRSAIVAALDASAAAEGARIEAALAAREAGGEEPGVALETASLAPGEAEQLVALAIAAGRWGFAPPRSAAGISAADAVEARRAASDLLGFLEQVEAGLAARLEAARPVGSLAALEPESSEPHPLASRPDAAAVASALAELVGRPGMPIGAPLPAATSVQPGDAPLEEWARTVAAVRADLVAPLGIGDGQLAPVADLAVFADDPDDPWRTAALAALDEWPDGYAPAEIKPAPRLSVTVAPTAPRAGETWEWVVLDSFVEHVPTSRPVAGASFDVATPSARPPQAILVVPPADPGAAEPTDEEVRGSVLYARMLAHARMALPSDLEAAGLGALSAWAALPQDHRTGAPLGTDLPVQPGPDQPAVLVPDPDDGDDTGRAVIGDALWMLGQQWRVGEHAGEDAATPLQLRLALRSTELGATAANPGMPVRTVPLEVAVEAEAQPLDAAAWQPEVLSYATAVDLDGGGTLQVPTHDADAAGWWSVTAESPTQKVPAGALRATRPSRLTWPGSPTGRYWQIDDRRTDVAGDGPDRTQPALLHLIDVIARVGEDLFVAPVDAVPGTVIRATDVTVTDAAGGTWSLRAPRGWSVTAIAGADGSAPLDPADDWHRAVPILVSGGGALEGPILDDVGIALDEDDNLLWVADLRATEPRDAVAGIPQGRVDDTSDLAWRWVLRRSVPHGRYPYLHGSAIKEPSDGHHEDAFVRADLVEPDGSLAPQPSSVLITEMPRLRPLAVPASGVRLVRRAVLARTVGGEPVLWYRRAKRPRDVPVDVDLRWDGLDRAQTAAAAADAPESA